MPTSMGSVCWKAHTSYSKENTYYYFENAIVRKNKAKVASIKILYFFISENFGKKQKDSKLILS